MKFNNLPNQAQECTGRGILGTYKLTPEEELEVLQENERRGLLHLIQERNSHPLNKNESRYNRAGIRL